MNIKVNRLEKRIGSFGEVSRSIKRIMKDVDALEIGLEVVPLGKLGDFSSEGEIYETKYHFGGLDIKDRIKGESEEGIVETVKNNLSLIKRGAYIEFKNGDKPHFYDITFYNTKANAEYISHMLS